VIESHYLVRPVHAPCSSHACLSVGDAWIQKGLSLSISGQSYWLAAHLMGQTQRKSVLSGG